MLIFSNDKLLILMTLFYNCLFCISLVSVLVFIVFFLLFILKLICSLFANFFRSNSKPYLRLVIYKEHKFIFHSCGDREPKIKVPVGLESAEG